MVNIQGRAFLSVIVKILEEYVIFLLLVFWFLFQKAYVLKHCRCMQIISQKLTYIYISF